ncbi:MAG: DUF1622 domain-containing protein [Methanobacterium sp.]
MVEYPFIILIIVDFLSYFGAIVIFYGGLRAVEGVLKIEILRREKSYNDIRLDFTSKIVLGLEFFIAADLIKSILEPTFDQLIVLAIIVAIRTVVGYSLTHEMKELEKNKKQ